MIESRMTQQIDHRSGHTRLVVPGAKHHAVQPREDNRLAFLTLDDKPAGHITLSPALDIPAMDADIATTTFKPDAAGAAALAAAKRNAVQYELKGSLSVGKGTTGKAQPFKLDGKGYMSPVPGVSNIWR